MKKLLMILPLVFLLCFTFSCQQQVEEVAEESGVKPLSDEDIAAIKAIGPALDKANLAGDWNGIVEMMTENVLLMNPNEQMIQGRTVVLEWFKAFEPNKFIEHKHELLEVDGYSDFAYARGAYKSAFVIEGIAEPIRLEGKTLLILRKQTDDSWLISRFCWSSDLPLPPSQKEDKVADIMELSRKTFAATADVEAIRDWVNKSYAAADSGDYEKYINFWAEDVIWMPPNAPIIQGMSAIKEMVQPYFEQVNIHHKISIEEIEVVDDFAFTRFNSEEKYTPRTGESVSMEANLKVIILLQRMADGTWAGTHCIWNSNYPLSTSQENQ